MSYADELERYLLDEPGKWCVEYDEPFPVPGEGPLDHVNRTSRFEIHDAVRLANANLKEERGMFYKSDTEALWDFIVIHWGRVTAL